MEFLFVFASIVFVVSFVVLVFTVQGISESIENLVQATERLKDTYSQIQLRGDNNGL
jgi:hypothetical protein